jgi:uncharacterized circularly permuted ATP-grasp superfamily protein
MKFDAYDTGSFFDEMFLRQGQPRDGARQLVQRIESLSDGELRERQAAAERAFLQMGITFNVYGDASGTEKIFPFDVVPRIVEAGEWEVLERGLRQRTYALNLFINDVYHDRTILKDGVVPAELIDSATSFRKQCIGLKPPRGIWSHISGTDLVRNDDGKWYVLEDNLRCPSGVSYVLENRQIMKRTLHQAFEACNVQPVSEYPSRLLAMLQYVAPDHIASPTVALLTPGIYNSAYLSRQADGCGTGRRTRPRRT